MATSPNSHLRDSTLTLVKGLNAGVISKVTTTQVVEMSVTVNNNIPIQDYLHRDNQTQYIDSCLNLLTMDTVFSPQGGCFGEIKQIKVSNLLFISAFLQLEHKGNLHWGESTR
ncbi:unnamed protein product, partial [Porites evermanni]